MQTKHSAPPNQGCGSFSSDRNRYFTGKFMTARDFESEQEYFVGRHRLHNRLMHGWGIVCGLRVVKHPNPECAPRWVVVRAGIAFDCCGREVVLRKDTPLELPLPQVPKQGEQPAEAAEGTMHAPFLLCIQYSEEPVEYVPALYAEGECDPTRKEANRLRESVHFEMHPRQDMPAECWKAPQGGMEAHCRDDCDEDLPGPAGTCIEPDCPCKDCVPLALIEFDPAHPEQGFNIDMQGRRLLPVPHDYLTHIAGINWPHGGEVTLSHLRRNMRGRLEIRFDRKILPVDGHKTGIGPYTFVVEYGGIQRDIEFLAFDRNKPPTLEEDCVAVFTLDPEALTPGRDEDDIAGNTVYVRLKCDFILDCHGNPVDGEHLRGRLPSGDGNPGGLFESWFRVLSDHAYAPREEEKEQPRQAPDEVQERRERRRI